VEVEPLAGEELWLGGGSGGEVGVLI
jgi:hypothetical protein